MKTSQIFGAACLLLSLALPALAQENASSIAVEQPDGAMTTTTKTVKKDSGGTAPGAAGGVIAGALVAGPIGAVMGGIAGATMGHTVAPPSQVRTYVTTQTTGPVSYQGPIEVGKRIDGEVVWREVPNYSRYHWARLNDQRVVVDDNHMVVAIYTN